MWGRQGKRRESCSLLLCSCNDSKDAFLVNSDAALSNTTAPETPELPQQGMVECSTHFPSQCLAWAEPLVISNTYKSLSSTVYRCGGVPKSPRTKNSRISGGPKQSERSWWSPKCGFYLKKQRRTTDKFWVWSHPVGLRTLTLLNHKGSVLDRIQEAPGQASCLTHSSILPLTSEYSKSIASLIGTFKTFHDRNSGNSSNWVCVGLNPLRKSCQATLLHNSWMKALILSLFQKWVAVFADARTLFGPDPDTGGLTWEPLHSSHSNLLEYERDRWRQTTGDGRRQLMWASRGHGHCACLERD